MNTLLPEEQSTTLPETQQTKGVKSYFEKPRRYLSRQADIRIRQETVREFTSQLALNRILDIGCGDGSISLPLVNAGNNLTLLDFSQSMAEIARSNVPPEFAENVNVLNGDFMKTQLPSKSYDLIICLGVLAHVDSPSEFLAKLCGLLRPGGSLILEFTDTEHFVGRLTRLYTRILSLRKPPTYPVNWLSLRKLTPILKGLGLRQTSCFRYTWWAFPLRLKQPTIYSLMRNVYGAAPRNRNAWLGNEYILLLTSK